MQQKLMKITDSEKSMIKIFIENNSDMDHDKILFEAENLEKESNQLVKFHKNN